jgi:peptidyl-tRNA hydrolase
MFWNDHVPPHFHARYGEYEITVEIDSGVVEGKFSAQIARSRARMASTASRGTALRMGCMPEWEGSSPDRSLGVH